MSDLIVNPYSFDDGMPAEIAALSGLVGWWDASDTTSITESSGAVSQWNDKSGNDHHFVQATAAAKPTTGTRTQNSKNVLDFDGGDTMRSATGWRMDTNRALQAYVVFAVDSTVPATQGIFGIHDDAGADAYTFRHFYLDVRTTRMGLSGGDGGSSTLAGVDYRAYYTTSTGIIGTSCHLVSGTLDDAPAFGINVDGGSSLPLTVYSGTMATTGYMADATTNTYHPVVGAAYTGTTPSASDYMNGFVAEIVVCDELQGATEVTNLNSYFNTKWSIY